ncbi:MAG: hypothetical protein JWO69_1469, partial [Thermoleophilia bacterium]|nr:hypothetical protein [Thermoleophilia bacterium]
HCNAYDYRVVSAFKALRSAGAIEATIVNDHRAPTVERSWVEAAPTGVAPKGGFIRPGHKVYLYAQIADDCGLDLSKLTVDASALGGGAALPLTKRTAGWSADGAPASFNYRAEFIASATLTDGATGDGAWHVNVDDGRDNEAVVDGASAVVDGTGPAKVGEPQAVSSDTNWFAGDTASIRAISAFQVYANLSDAGSGLVGTPRLNASDVGLGANNLAMSAGTYPIGTHTYGFRSADRASRLLGHGSARTFSIAVTDRLGNASTVIGTAHFDNIAPKLVSCTMRSDDQYWGNGDTTTLDFNEGVLPSSALSAWSGAAKTINATVMNGVFLPDFISYGGNFILSHHLGSRDWITGIKPSRALTSAITATTATQWTISYAGGGQGIDIPSSRSNASILMAAGLRDAAGNTAFVTGAECGIEAAAASRMAAPVETEVIVEAPAGDLAPTGPAIVEEPAAVEQPVAEQPAVVEAPVTPEPATSDAPVETPEA